MEDQLNPCVPAWEADALPRNLPRGHTRILGFLSPVEIQKLCDYKSKKLMPKSRLGDYLKG